MEQLQQAIDKDDAQSALAILEKNRVLLNQYCVPIHFRFLLQAVQLTNLLPICLTIHQMVCILQEEFYNTNAIIQSFPECKYSGREGEYFAQYQCNNPIIPRE